MPYIGKIHLRVLNCLVGRRFPCSPRVVGLVKNRIKLIRATMQLPMTRNHQFHRACNNAAAQAIVGGRRLAHHTHGIDELHRMHLRQRLFVDFTAVFGKNTTQDIGSRLGYAPVLVADNVGQALEEGDRGVGIEQPAFELTPIAAMQVLGDKDAALHYAREIQCERFDDVARQMGAVIDDDVELWRAL